MARAKTYRPGRGYTKADWDAVSDNPEWTKEDFAKARPFAEVFPELAALIRRRGPQKAPTKKLVSLRLDSDLLDSYRKAGKGWQTKLNDDLRKVRKLGAASQPARKRAVKKRKRRYGEAAE